MGKAWKFGNDVNTDVITPGRFNLTADPKELAKICFIELRPEFYKEVKQGDIIVAGRNFGCGSSRETAPVSIKAAGIKAVIAKSFARIFYRNCINIGLPALESEEAADGINDKDELEVDLSTGAIKNNSTGKAFNAKPLPSFALGIVKEGGIVNYLNKTDGDFGGL